MAAMVHSTPLGKNMAFSWFSFVVSEFALAESDLLLPYTNEWLVSGVFKTRNGEMTIYFSFCFRGKNPIEPGPARKHSTHLHRKSRSFHTANSCKAVLETFHLPIVSIVHPKCREDGAFCFTAISFYFLRPCFLVGTSFSTSHSVYNIL